MTFNFFFSHILHTAFCFFIDETTIQRYTQANDNISNSAHFMPKNNSCLILLTVLLKDHRTYR